MSDADEKKPTEAGAERMGCEPTWESISASKHRLADGDLGMAFCFLIGWFKSAEIHGRREPTREDIRVALAAAINSELDPEKTLQGYLDNLLTR